MAGRWRMASVQMSFAIMPAAVYWFAGYSIAHGSHAISIGTVVAFTTLQTRLLFPMQSLLSVGLEVQTSLALFGRIFEYLDLPVDIVERPGARALERRARRREPRGRVVPLRARGALDAAARSAPRSRRARAPRWSARPARARRRSPIWSRACTSPSAARVRIDGVDIRDVTLDSLAATVGLVSQETYLFHASIRENLRFACPRGERRGDRRRRPGGADPRADRLAARGLRHARRRARLPLLRRREAAHRDRPHDPAQPAGADPRRGDLGARHRDRARRAAGARRALARAHHDRDRPPAVDDPRRRPDPRARRRADRRARHPRGAARRSAAATRRCCAGPPWPTDALAPDSRPAGAPPERLGHARPTASMFRRT